MAGCPNCGQDIPNVFQGGVLYQPDEHNNIYLPDLADNAEWDGVGGSGITIEDDGTNPPSVEVCLFPSADNAAQFIDGCLNVPSAASSPEWTTPNFTTQGGITASSGGQQGHNPSFSVSVSPDSKIGGSFSASGQLLLEPADDIKWQGSPDENVTIVSGDNPGGAAGNGHRPRIGLRDGAALCPPLRFRCTENANQTFRVEIFNPLTNASIDLGTV